jgi:indolepyruvate ferredoxin oxidoreductase
MERQLIVEYRDMILSLLDTLSADRLALAIEIAGLPEKVRGFGHVKESAVEQYQTQRKILMEKYTSVQKGLPHAA